MSCPLSSIANPLNPSEILLFYLIEQGTVGLERHNFEDKYKATKFSDNGVPDVDFIANPASFSALTFNGLMNVYGLVKEPAAPPAPGATASGTLTKTPVEANKVKRIAQLSPAYKILASEEFNQAQGIALTSTIDDLGQGWLYFINVKNSNPVIREIKLDWDSSSLTSTITAGPPLLATNLAAAYDPKLKKRLIVYQNSKTLRVVDHAGNNDTEVPNTGDSQDSTGLALVSVKSGGGVKLYLYYFSSKGTLLQRVVRDENGAWGSSSVVEGAKDAEKTTFLTATLVKDKIVLFYIASDSKKSIYVFQDSL
ncbi:hypothetical protein AOQ84DRAFT_378684 [Glonium stellatum]|uniref:Fucose-specific lectin n=1 Tax=Glonium stellatum TaxID=574774 RepID=A0A8E2EWR6_9PEZI|nr:hypothetical protein AOQ84DRAFT_378684 [Glonium stellatum]